MTFARLNHHRFWIAALLLILLAYAVACRGAEVPPRPRVVIPVSYGAPETPKGAMMQMMRASAVALVIKPGTNAVYHLFWDASNMGRWDTNYCAWNLHSTPPPKPNVMAQWVNGRWALIDSAAPVNPALWASWPVVRSTSNPALTMLITNKAGPGEYFVLSFSNKLGKFEIPCTTAMK